MTENTALSHMTPSPDERHGSVGVLLPNLECKVKDLLKAPIIFHRSLLPCGVRKTLFVSH